MRPGRNVCLGQCPSTFLNDQNFVIPIGKPSGAFIKLPALRVVHDLNAILVRPKNLNILYLPHFVLITFTYR